MLVDIETQIIFPRRVLCIEVSLKEATDRLELNGYKAMIFKMLDHQDSKSAFQLLMALKPFRGIDTSSWLVEMIDFSFERQCFWFLVSSPMFPKHREGCVVQIVQDLGQLLKAMEL
jgi:hypothetical protein